MFWIPIAFLVFIGYLIKEACISVGNMKYRPTYTIPADKVSDARMRFIARTTLTDEERRIVCDATDNATKSLNIVRDFMGRDDPYADKYFFSSANAAKMIEAAKLGKLWDDGRYIGYRIGILHDEGAPRGKALELTERFLLKIEDELRRHGVPNAVIMADYREYYFSSVRERVNRCGYGVTPLRTNGGGLAFKWAPFTERWDGSPPNFE